jgi:hypothetical protein
MIENCACSYGVMEYCETVSSHRFFTSISVTRIYRSERQHTRRATENMGNGWRCGKQASNTTIRIYSHRGLRLIRRRLLAASSPSCQYPEYHKGSRPTWDGTAAVGIGLRFVLLHIINPDVHWPPPSIVTTTSHRKVSERHWKWR